MSINVELLDDVAPYLVSPYESFFFLLQRVKLTVESGKCVFCALHRVGGWVHGRYCQQLRCADTWSSFACLLDVRVLQRIPGPRRLLLRPRRPLLRVAVPRRVCIGHCRLHCLPLLLAAILLHPRLALPREHLWCVRHHASPVVFRDAIPASCLSRCVVCTL